MNLRFIEAFYWTATLRSVTRAAEKLGLTQSATSNRIATLEAELGVALFDRRDRQLRLTNAGMRLATYAERLLELQCQLLDELSGGSDARSARVLLRVGAIESVLHSWLGPWLDRLRHRHPSLTLELSIEQTPVLLDKLERGALDLVFAALPAHAAGLATRAMPPMAMVFVGHPGLHREKHYEVEQLRGQTLMTFQRGSQAHAALLDLFRQRELGLPRVHSVSSVPAMIRMVELGFGIAALPAAVTGAGAEGRRGRFRILDVNAQLDPLPVFASYRNDPSSGLIRDVAGMAFEYVGRHPYPSASALASELAR